MLSIEVNAIGENDSPWVMAISASIVEYITAEKLPCDLMARCEKSDRMSKTPTAPDPYTKLPYKATNWSVVVTPASEPSASAERSSSVLLRWPKCP